MTSFPAASSPAASFEVTACVLLHREGHWLLGVRHPDAAYAGGALGLIGGHVDIGPGRDTLEDTARREAAEEAGLDLGAIELHYLESLQYAGREGRPSVDVTFVAELADGQEPVLSAPDELTAVRWWNRSEVAADPRSPDWLPDLLDRAEAALRLS